MTPPLNIPILYEDDDLAVINKPPGLVVNRSATVKEYTLQDWWQERLGDAWRQRTFVTPADFDPTFGTSSDFDPQFGTPTEIFQERGGIVHRLDKETSGVLILAKHPGALLELLRQFRTRLVQKKYVCLVHGKFTILEDTVALSLSRSVVNRTKFTVSAEGRQAQTAYAVRKYFPHFQAEKARELLDSIPNTQLRKKVKEYMERTEGFSLVECEPKTGRTHQIRVHMAHLQHPIVADTTYLGKKRKELDVLWCPRLFLHAARIEFTQPMSQKVMSVEAELPEDLRGALGMLGEG